MWCRGTPPVVRTLAEQARAGRGQGSVDRAERPLSLLWTVVDPIAANPLQIDAACPDRRPQRGGPTGATITSAHPGPTRAVALLTSITFRWATSMATTILTC